LEIHGEKGVRILCSTANIAPISTAAIATLSRFKNRNNIAMVSTGRRIRVLDVPVCDSYRQPSSSPPPYSLPPLKLTEFEAKYGEKMDSSYWNCRKQEATMNPVGYTTSPSVAGF
jgi:hypothetical protein